MIENDSLQMSFQGNPVSWKDKNRKKTLLHNNAPQKSAPRNGSQTAAGS